MIVYGIVQQHGIAGLTIATLMAGVIFVMMGVAKLGGMVKFIPHPVITEFTAGIAVIIYSGEVKNLLGLHMGDVAEVTNISAVTRELSDELLEGEEGDLYQTDPNGIRRRRIPAGVEVYEINGPFFFGAAEMFKETLAQIADKPKVLVIRMRDVLALDSTGMHALKDVVHRSRKDGTTVLLSDVHMQPLVALTGSSVLDEIGGENIFANLDDALNRARTLVGIPTQPAPEGARPTVKRER